MKKRLHQSARGNHPFTKQKPETNHLSNLLEATKNSNLVIMEYFLRHKADIEEKNSKGQTALIVAAKIGNMNAIKLLLKNGANIDATDNRYKSALIHSIEKNHTEVIELLLKKGANILDDNIDATPVLIAAVRTDNIKLVELLLEKGADIEEVDILGNTPLIYACSIGNQKMVQLLLDRGAKINGCNFDCHTPLIYASYEGKFHIVKLLLENGVDAQMADYKGKLAEDTAFRKGHNDIYDLLTLAIQIETYIKTPCKFMKFSLVNTVDKNFIASLFKSNMIRYGYTDYLFRKFNHVNDVEQTFDPDLFNIIKDIFRINNEIFNTKFAELLQIVSDKAIPNAPLTQLIKTKLENQYLTELEIISAEQIVEFYKQKYKVIFSDGLNKIFTTSSTFTEQQKELLTSTLNQEIQEINLKILLQNVNDIIIHSADACNIVSSIISEVALPKQTKDAICSAQINFQELIDNPIYSAMSNQIAQASKNKNEQEQKIAQLEKKLAEQENKIMTQNQIIEELCNNTTASEHLIEESQLSGNLSDLDNSYNENSSEY